MRRSLPWNEVGTVFLVSLVLAPWACPAAEEATSRPKETTASLQTSESLDSLLEPIRERHRLPALAAAAVRDGEVIARGAVGLRAIGSVDPVTVDDLWHIGSCTKAFTSTLIALLVDQGKLSWTTTIGEVFPDFASEIRPEYLDVTIEQLLRHRSGLPTDRRPDPGIRSQLRSLSGSIREQRRQAAKLVLRQAPAAPAGTKMMYSNYGYMVAGAMAEEVTGHSWEELLRERIFDPLGMSTAGFGAPGLAGALTQPRGHRRGVPVEPGPLADNAPVIGPAGTIHLSLADWAKFAALHLAGLRGESDFLKPETFTRLYTPSPGGDVALGWGVDDWPGGIGRLVTHAGSNGSWFARIVLSPTRNLAILVTINSSGPEAGQATDETVLALLRRFTPAPGVTAPQSTDDHRIAAPATQPSPPAVDPGDLTNCLWIGRSPAGDSVYRLETKGGRLTGYSYLVREGKALTEIPVDGASLSAEARDGGDQEITVEMQLKTGWAYRGRLSADRSRIDGELETGGGRRVDLDLVRAGLDAVPAIYPRAPGALPWTSTRPEATDDGWTTANAADVGLDVGALRALIGDVTSGEAGLVHSLLLVRGDKLVLEEYFHGFTRDDLHQINSCTKSVASLLVGIALERGELAGVQTTLLELFPELRPVVAAGLDGLTVEHLLTMTSGVEPPRGGRPPAGPALVRAALTVPPAAPPGTRWRYSDMDADLLAAVLQRCSGVQADAYAARHLFAPLGITSWDWEDGRTDGYPRLYGTLRLRPRDLAKLGSLVLSGGRWKGRQVVPGGVGPGGHPGANRDAGRRIRLHVVAGAGAGEPSPRGRLRTRRRQPACLRRSGSRPGRRRDGRQPAQRSRRSHRRGPSPPSAAERTPCRRGLPRAWIARQARFPGPVGTTRRSDLPSPAPGSSSPCRSLFGTRSDDSDDLDPANLDRALPGTIIEKTMREKPLGLPDSPVGFSGP